MKKLVSLLKTLFVEMHNKARQELAEKPGRTYRPSEFLIPKRW